jgi:hypothetical protein
LWSGTGWGDGFGAFVITTIDAATGAMSPEILNANFGAARLRISGQTS